MKKVMFFSVGIISLLALLDPTMTVLMMLPIVIYLVLSYLNIWKKVKNGTFIFSMAAVMFIVNIYAVSVVDVIMWGLIMFAHREVL